MIHRMKIDLDIARNEKLIPASRFASFYVGECDGDVIIQLNDHNGAKFHPDEIEELTNIENIEYFCITNTAQVGKKLVLYVKEKELKPNLFRRLK